MNDKDVLQHLLKKIEKIESRLENIETLLQGPIQENTDKMKTHIDFVENVYEKVRYPMNFICKRFNSLQGSRVDCDFKSIEDEKSK